jgi:hypothetical protein
VSYQTYYWDGCCRDCIATVSRLVGALSKAPCSKCVPSDVGVQADIGVGRTLHMLKLM